MRWVVAKIGTELLITETGEREGSYPQIIMWRQLGINKWAEIRVCWCWPRPGLWLVRSGLIPASDWLIISLARVIIKTLATIGNNETNQSSDCESLAVCVTDEPNVSISSVLRSSSHPDSAETRPSGSQWGRRGGPHVSGLKARLLSEYNCCFHFHEKLLALELGREIENQTLLLSPDSDHCKYCPSRVLSHHKLQTAVSPQLKRDVWGLELQPRVFTKRLIVSLGSRLLLNGGSTYPRYFVLLKTLRVPREADPHTLQQRGHFDVFWLVEGLIAVLSLV